MNEQILKNRVTQLLTFARDTRNQDSISNTNELYQGTLTVMVAAYGPESYQVKALTAASMEVHSRKHMALEYAVKDLHHAAAGALKNLHDELSLGLAGSLEKHASGSVLTDFLQLAREVLNEPGDNAKNVAAVLAAAAFEDTIRRLGSTLAGVMGKDDLSDVIAALKSKGILVSPQLGIALSFLNFRNKALHANWNEIDRAAVNSVLGFVQELLLKHF